MSQTSRVENVCETQPQTESDQSDFVLRWRVTYPQVTIPVAGAPELGAAFKRLHVPVTPTSNGTGGLQGSTYSISGMAPSQNGLCDSVPFDTAGSLQGDGSKPSIQEINSPLPEGATRTLVGLSLGDLGSASPAKLDNYHGGHTDDVLTQANLAFMAVPAPAGDGLGLKNPEPSWNLLTLDEPYTTFRPLLRQSSVAFNLPAQGSKDCGTTTDPGVSSSTCALSYTIGYRVILHKRMLYRTRRAYRR